MTISTANNLNLGGRPSRPLFFSAWTVPISDWGVDVVVAVGVIVEAGNIKVIAGSGIRVVVGVFEDVIVGVNVWGGVLEGPVGDCVTVSGVPD